MTATLFISYSHADMQDTNWIDRLRMYLTPFMLGGGMDIWDDSRIATGTLWEEEIDRALHSAAVAILLVGPGFLASKFVMEREVPALLNSAKVRGVALFPLIVGWCAYDASNLRAYQAHNSPDHPLESLSRSEQNRILNELAIAVDKSIRSEIARHDNVPLASPDLYDSMRDIQKNLMDTQKAIIAQSRRRNALVESIEQRIGKSDLEYEKFFYKYYSQLNDEERFEFNQIRAITEGLERGNRKILKIIEAHPAILEAIPQMTDLRQHLVFWLNKYDRFFLVNPAMCVLYTGVEDGVPFPKGVDHAVASWLSKHKPPTS
jgi:hypothetical protein